MKKIRLLLADDHNILRQGLANILERYDDFCVVAEAEDGYSMVNKYFSFHPDVVLCDIEMPGMNGLETIKKIRDINSKIGVVLMSGYSLEEAIVKEIEDKDGLAFIKKPYEINNLVDIVKEKLGK